MNDDLNQCLNRDKELWREIPNDYYSDSLHVTSAGAIGINVAGHVFVLTAKEWHRLAKNAQVGNVNPPLT